ncbi:hypothetical protein BJX76DRAFT_291509 [Aspergillus varians]
MITRSHPLILSLFLLQRRFACFFSPQTPVVITSSSLPTRSLGFNYQSQPPNALAAVSLPHHYSDGSLRRRSPITAIFQNDLATRCIQRVREEPRWTFFWRSFRTQCRTLWRINLSAIRPSPRLQLGWSPAAV